MPDDHVVNFLHEVAGSVWSATTKNELDEEPISWLGRSGE